MIEFRIFLSLPALMSRPWRMLGGGSAWRMTKTTGKGERAEGGARRVSARGRGFSSSVLNASGICAPNSHLTLALVVLQLVLFCSKQNIFSCQGGSGVIPTWNLVPQLFSQSNLQCFYQHSKPRVTGPMSPQLFCLYSWFASFSLPA